MKVRFLFVEDLDCDLTVNETYEVLSIEKGWYRIVDDSEEDYLYPPDIFEIVEKEPVPHISD